MQRILPALAAFALVIAGVVGGLFLLASRDHGSLAPATTPQPSTATVGDGPFGLPAGNVVVTYRSGADRVRIDRLAERLGAIDSAASRAAGQALVSKADTSAGGIVATNGPVTLALASTDDPALAAFVRQHLGRTP